MDDRDSLHPAVRGLKTVCRCNNIKYRTIERAIRAGACTLTQIANRTTATTGHCGGSCTPDVQQMLDELVERSNIPAIELSGSTARPLGSSAAEPWWLRNK